MISIVTPTYNSEEYLEECIMSIMNQSCKDFEHIIVDGGSTDGTIQIIRKYEGKYNMRWISEPDEGMYDAIAKGFNMARGDIFCWLNSDDIFVPWTVQVVSYVFSKGKFDWITGVAAQMDSKGHSYIFGVVTYPHFCIKNGWMDSRRVGCIQQESTFWTKELYNKVGGLNTNYKLAGDYHLWYVFSAYSKLYTVNSLLANFRVHDAQKSADKEKYRSETCKLNLIQRLLLKLRVYGYINYILKKLDKSLLIEVNKI